MLVIDGYSVELFTTQGGNVLALLGGQSRELFVRSLLCIYLFVQLLVHEFVPPPGWRRETSNRGIGYREPSFGLDNTSCVCVFYATAMLESS